ncbi:MAG: hypothetical protein ACT4QG_06855 [Sporichthyaceae bacterium]
MEGGYRVDTDALRALSTDLADQGDALRPSACGSPPKPDAGRSSSEAGDALEHLVDATIDLSRVLAEIAERLRRSAELYEKADSDAQADLERIARRWMPGG